MSQFIGQKTNTDDRYTKFTAPSLALAVADTRTPNPEAMQLAAKQRDYADQHMDDVNYRRLLQDHQTRGVTPVARTTKTKFKPNGKM